MNKLLRNKILGIMGLVACLYLIGGEIGTQGNAAVNPQAGVKRQAKAKRRAAAARKPRQIRRSRATSARAKRRLTNATAARVASPLVAPVSAAPASAPANTPTTGNTSAAAGGVFAPTSIEPFSAIANEIKQGNSTRLRFARTKLDNLAQATAQVSLRGRTLFVRVRAVNLPYPSRYKQNNYVLWADLPNYGQKLFLGDLPLVNKRRRTGRGDSDTAYYSAALPEGASFGGLMLTAEPKRIGASPSEPLQLLLIALPSKQASGKLVATSSPASPTGAKIPAPKVEARKNPKQ